jgi:3-oxoacyl-[acyl-carrier protein] reductase
MEWGADEQPLADHEVDLADPNAPDELFRVLGGEPITAMVLCHAESVDSDIQSTPIESFDRHFAVNARASWLLIRAFASQFPAGATGSGRIVALTSDHTAFNLPYGASKAALDRIVIAAATELAELGITANVVNPGANDTGWMDETIEGAVRRGNLQGRIGTPADTASLVGFLLSDEGGWINAQLLHSDGGRRPG